MMRRWARGVRFRRWGRVLLAAQAAAAIVVVCRALAWLQPAELAVYDRLIAARAGKDESRNILIASVTEADIERYGWPLRDGDLASLLSRLDGWGARAVGVDLYRDRPLPPGDVALADVLRAHGNLVWVYKLADEFGQGVLPPAILAGSQRAVLADVVADAGGVVRRGLLAATDPHTGHIVRTLGAALAEQFTGERLRLAGDDIALGRGRLALVSRTFGPYARVDAAGYQVLLDFDGGRGRFRHVSVGDLLQRDDAAGLVRNRVVLIGSEAPSVKDSFPTPLTTGFAGGGQFTGIMVHASLADQLIRAHDGETAGRTVLPRAAETFVIWGCSMAAAAASVVVPAEGLALIATVAGGVGAIGWVAYAALGLTGVVLPAFPAALAWLASAAGAIWVLHGAAIRERRRMRQTFEHYLDPRIIEDLLAKEALPSFGGERREVTVMFTDIAGFTTLAEALPAEDVGALLRDYFDGVCDAILACGGLVSVFHGDGLQVLFGAPRHQDDHADRAVDAALRIDAFAARFSAQQREKGIGLGATRIGVHTDVALVGNVGTRARLNYGAVGDVVNTASRIEGLNKWIGSRLSVSGATAQRCVRHRFRPVGEFVLQGRRDALLIMAPLTPAEAADQPYLTRYEAAYAALDYDNEAARAMFAAMERDDPCAKFHSARLAAGETGVRIVMKEK